MIMAPDTKPILADPDVSPNGVLGDFRVPDLFRDLPDAVIVANVERRIVWVNPAFESLFGYSLQELTGELTKDLYAEAEVYTEMCQGRYGTMPAPSDHSYEVRYRRKSGKTFLTQTTGGPIRNPAGDTLGFFAIIKDISRTRAYEELLHRLFHISSDQSMESTAKVQAILKLGCAHFQTDSGLVSWVRDDRYTVLYNYSELVEIARGTTFSLGETYCSEVMKSNAPLACHSARKSNFSTHSCYDLFLLETYIGVPLIVDGTQFGTLNFSSPEERHPFESGDLEMIKMFAAWIGQQLSFEKATNQLPIQS